MLLAVAVVAKVNNQKPDTMEVNKKVSQTNLVIPPLTIQNPYKSKWRQALIIRKEKLVREIERKRREEEELEKKREAAQKQRHKLMDIPKLSRLALLEERQKQVEELNKKRMLLKVQAKADESKRKSNQQSWCYVIKQVKNLESIAKAEQELEKVREREKIEEERKNYRKAKEAERLKIKEENKTWQHRISCQVRIATEKLRRKRIEEQGNTPLFTSRFRKIQLEIKKRKQREKMRELKIEEARLQEKKKRHEKELIRRAEVSARLDHMQKIQQLNDKKKSELMERARKEHDAELAVYEAQKKIMHDIVGEMKKHEAKVKKQREQNAREKADAEKKEKLRQEIQRRVAVSAAVAKGRKLARALAERRANQLAAEESARKLKKKENLKYNQWVREHWAKRAKQARQRKLLQQCKELENRIQENERKKQDELKRRESVKLRIEKNNQLKDKNKKNDCAIVQPPSSITRRQFLDLKKAERDENISRQKLLKAAQLSHVNSEQDKNVYSKNFRHMELKRCNKEKVVQKATKRAWR